LLGKFSGILPYNLRTIAGSIDGDTAAFSMMRQAIDTPNLIDDGLLCLAFISRFLNSLYQVSPTQP
jgi:hypothetical protein